MWLQVLVIVYYDRVDLHGTSPGRLYALAAAGSFRRGPWWHGAIVPPISLASWAVMVLYL